MFAGYLAKLGDDRALPDLTNAAQEEKLPYLTFIEIRNAIETLGGICPERNYDDDPEYRAKDYYREGLAPRYALLRQQFQYGAKLYSYSWLDPDI